MAAKRSFNGCWTCRFRKVKCDATRPNCQRCLKSGNKCEGYDIKLTFSHITSTRKGRLVNLVKRNETDDKFYRRVIKFSKFPPRMVYETYSQLDAIVDNLDEYVRAGHFNKNIGPFTVYEPYTIQKSSSVHQILNNDQPNDKENPEVVVDKNGNSLIHSDLVGLAKVSIYGIKGPRYEVNDQNIYHILYPTFFPNIDSDEWLPQENYIKQLIHGSVSGDITASNAYIYLVDSFNNLKLTFVKVNYPNNVWEKVVKPYLNCLMFEFLLSKETEATTDYDDIENSLRRDHLLKKNLKLIINYLILSIACFNKSAGKYSIEDNKDIDDDLKVSIGLRKLALNLLNNHLDGYDDHCNIDEEYDLLLTLSIILQIEIDSYFNIYENFNLLFAIGDFVVKQTKPQSSFKDLSLVAKTLFNIMNIFFLSTQNINVYNYNIPDEDYELYEDLKDTYDLTKNAAEIQSDSSDGEESSDSLGPPKVINNSMSFTVRFEGNPRKDTNTDSTIDEDIVEDYIEEQNFDPDPSKYNVDINHVYLLYGIPRSLINLFSRIVNLTNHKRVFQTEKKYPRNFPKICSDMEEELEKWRIQWKLTKDGNEARDDSIFLSKFHQLIYFNISIFHTSLKIYFKRLIKNEIHQHLIEKVLMDIEKLDSFKVSSGIQLDLMPIFWCILICGSDNLNKRLNPKFLRLSNQYGNISYWRSKQLMYEVWNRRDLGEETSWMETIREWDIVLYLG